MTPTEIKNARTDAASLLADGRITEAVKRMRNTAEGAMLWEISDRLQQVGKNYTYMLRYLTDGAVDPGRDAMYTDIVAELWHLLDVLDRALRMRFAPNTLYLNTLRSIHNSGGSLSAYIQRWRTHTEAGHRPEAEGAERDIFNFIWTSLPLGAQSAEELEALMAEAPRRLRELVVAALTMGLLEYFDEHKLAVLGNMYLLADDNDDDTAVTTATAMALALYAARNRRLPVRTVQRLQALAELPQWHARIKAVMAELINVRDTQRISDTMQNEILPDMMKMQPDIMERLNNMDKETALSEDFNPEWEELLNKSGIADRMRQLSEMQSDGSDIFMATFGHLKHFGHFNEVANWFVPFESTATAVTQSGLSVAAARFIERLPLLCANDKYSFFLALSMVPEEQRQLMMTQFEQQADAMREDAAHSVESLSPETQRRRTAKNFLQNLYRFLKLFRRKGEFYNPIDDGINLLAVPVAAPWLEEDEMLRTLAEMFFHRKMWTDAEAAFGRWDELYGPDGTVFQKQGYCRERLGQPAQAADCYRQAELFDAAGPWLLTRLGNVLNASGNYAEAAEVYERLQKIQPDEVAPAIRLGNIAMRQHHYEKAARHFFKAEYLDPENLHVRRALARCLTMTKRFDDSQRRYDSIPADQTTASDLLGSGLLAMAAGRFGDAARRYAAALSALKNDRQEWLQKLAADNEAAAQLGIDPQLRNLVIDAATLENNS